MTAVDGMGVIRQRAREAMIRAAAESHPCLDGPSSCTHTDCYYDALLTAALEALNHQGAVEDRDAALAALDRIAGIWEPQSRAIAREALDAIRGGGQ